MAINPKLLNEGETVVVSTRTHPKALILPMLILLAVLAAAIFSDRASPTATSPWACGSWPGSLAIWFVVRPVLEWLTATYTITDRRLITRRGFLVRRGHDIPLNRISDVAYELGPIDRMLGCGTLIISDASTHGRVLLHDIPHVEDTQRVLNQLLHEKTNHPAADDGT